jgi:hypothetical protein
VNNWDVKPDEKDFKLAETRAGELALEAARLLDINPETMPAEVLAAYKANMEKLARAYRLGSLENKLEGGGLVIAQTTRGGQVIEYREPTGADFRLLDKIPSGAYYERIQFLAGKTSGLGVEGIGKLSGRDLKTAEAVAGLFLLA